MRARFTHGQATSRPEARLRRILVSSFGKDAVKQQVRMGRWTVDFYVVPLDVYVELDGVYWHGLDRPMDVIERCGTLTDRKILGTWHKDRLQDAWFGDNGIRLIRITDKELRGYDDADVLERVKAASLPGALLGNA